MKIEAGIGVLVGEEYVQSPARVSYLHHGIVRLAPCLARRCYGGTNHLASTNSPSLC